MFVVLALVFNAGGPADDDVPAATTSAPRAELPPLDVQTPDLTPEADAVCPGLIGGLPLDLDGLPARPVRSATAYAYAWGDPPVVLRCAVPRPAALGPEQLLTGVNGIDWFVEPGAEQTVWTTVDRAVYVELTVPSDLTAGPATLLADVIADRVPVLSGPGASPTPTR